MKLTKENTKILQGIAILFMFGLHLFNRTEIADYYDVYLYVREGGAPLLTYVSYIFDACVPIYLFCSGYGLYTSEERTASTVKTRFSRILKLLIRFWIVLILTCIVGYCFGMKEIYPGTLLNFVLNIFLVKSSYVGAFWFVQTYVLLVLTSIFIFKFVKKHSWIVTIMFSMGLYVVAFGMEYLVLGQISSEVMRLFVNALMLFCRSQFSFVLGAIFVKEDIIDNRSKLISKIRESKLLVWLIILVVVCVREKFAHMIFAPFSAIILIVLLGTYDWGKFGKRILLFFGRHSTNMWLVHMQFYMIFTPKLVFCSRNVFVIMLTLIGLSLASSYVIDFIYNIIMRFLTRKCSS